MAKPERNCAERNRRRILCGVLLLLPMLAGCRFMVAAGKMVFGDPVNTSAFELTTGRNLQKSGDPVLIICTAPHHVLAKYPAVQLELVDRISQRLERQGIRVVPSDDVAAWYDDHGEWGDYSELAAEFSARYIMHVELESFRCLEPASPDLMRGRSEGRVRVHEIHPDDGHAGLVFEQNLHVMFPETYPVPRESKSLETFVENLLDRISLQAAQMMYDHRLRDTIH